MAKMSPEEKLVAAQRYVNRKESSRAVAADIGVSLSSKYKLQVSPPTVVISVIIKIEMINIETPI